MTTLLATPGGKRTHLFLPFIRVFQALVWRGSMWTVVPLLSGPTRNHL